MAIGIWGKAAKITCCYSLRLSQWSTRPSSIDQCYRLDPADPLICSLMKRFERDTEVKPVQVELEQPLSNGSLERCKSGSTILPLCRPLSSLQRKAAKLNSIAVSLLPYFIKLSSSSSNWIPFGPLFKASSSSGGAFPRKSLLFRLHINHEV